MEAMDLPTPPTPTWTTSGDSQASDDTVDLDAEKDKPDVILFDMATNTPWKIRDRNVVLPATTTLHINPKLPKWRTSALGRQGLSALIPYDDFALTDIGLFVFNGGEASAKALIETGQLPTDDDEVFSSFDSPDQGRKCIWAARVCFGGLDLAADASVYYNAVRYETAEVGSSVYVPLTDLQCGQWRQKIRKETHAMAQGTPSKLSFYGRRLHMMDSGRCMPSLGWTDTMSHLEDSGCISRLEQFEKDDFDLRIDLLTFRVLQTWAQQLPTHYARKVETEGSEQARRVARAVLPGPCDDVPLPRPSKNLDALVLAANAARRLVEATPPSAPLAKRAKAGYKRRRPHFYVGNPDDDPVKTERKEAEERRKRANAILDLWGPMHLDKNARPSGPPILSRHPTAEKEVLVQKPTLTLTAYDKMPHAVATATRAADSDDDVTPVAMEMVGAAMARRKRQAKAKDKAPSMTLQDVPFDIVSKIGSILLKQDPVATCALRLTSKQFRDNLDESKEVMLSRAELQVQKCLHAASVVELMKAADAIVADGFDALKLLQKWTEKKQGKRRWDPSDYSYAVLNRGLRSPLWHLRNVAPKLPFGRRHHRDSE